MSNKSYNEFPADTKSKEGGKGGMKNDDGRIAGAEFGTDSKSGKISPKEVIDPNANVPSLGSQGGAEGGH